MEEERYPSLPWQGWKIVKKLGRGGYGSVISGTAKFCRCHGRCRHKSDFFPQG